VSRQKYHPHIVIPTLCALLIVITIAGIMMGTNRLSFAQLLHVAVGQGDWFENLTVIDLRMPRMLVALLIGAGIATAGVLMQGMTRNDLAGPDTIGTNAGSGLGMIFLLVAYPTNSMSDAWFLPIGAVVGAIAMTVLVFSLAYRRGSVLPSRLLLVGIAVGFGAHAAMLMLSMRMGFTTYNFVLTWMSGSLASASWKSVCILAISCVVLLPIAFCCARVLNTLSLGETVAASLGVAVERERLYLLGLATCITSICVAVGGHIGFLGLAAPHLARRLVGHRHGTLFPAAALCGSLLLLLGDTLGRSLFAPIEMPAGVLVGVLGGAYFLYLLAVSKY
jgi:iron complex transport system permease protein